MRRILIAWELGRNWGHLGRQLPLARALRERGYEVHFAVRDRDTASLFLEAAGFDSHLAPPAPPRSPRRAMPENFAGVLLTLGYGQLAASSALVSGWLDIFERLQPAAVIADFAPAALIAARVSKQPLVTLGLGFEHPPPTHPLPALQPWRSPPTERLVRAENALLDTINTVVGAHASAPLLQLGQLFAGFEAILTTFPEFDHYSGRSRGTYVGPIYCAPEGAIEAHWPSGPGPRLLAYLGAQTRGLEAVTVALGASGTTLACVPGWTPPDHIIQSSCRVYPEALFLDNLLSQADAFVTNGNLTTSTRALLAGIPVLAIPNNLEQHIGALRIVELGAGLMVENDRSERELRALLRKLLAPSFKENARRFAARYVSESVTQAVERAVTVIERVAVTGYGRFWGAHSTTRGL